MNIGIMGADTLLGREIKELVEKRGSSTRLRAYGLDPKKPAKELSEDAEITQPLTAEVLQDLSLLVLAGSAAESSQAYDMTKMNGAGRGPLLIDCLGQLESLPEARVIAPLVTEVSTADLEGSHLQVIAHPVASAMALVMTRLQRVRKLRTLVANVLVPASERGKAGVSELHQQTTALLNFKKLEKTVFDTQVSFNLLPRVGEDAAAQLIQVENRIARHLRNLLARGSAELPVPSVRVAQAPVFHGFSISVWLEFDTAIPAQEVEEALASAQIEIRGASEEPPDNVGAAGQSGLIVGDVRVDRSNERAVWLWVVMDNLKTVADAAADIIRAFSSGAPGAAAAEQRL